MFYKLLHGFRDSVGIHICTDSHGVYWVMSSPLLQTPTWMLSWEENKWNSYLRTKNDSPAWSVALKTRRRTAKSFPIRGHSPGRHQAGLIQCSGSIQINDKQVLVCWELQVQGCLSTIQQVYSSFGAWQASLAEEKPPPFSSGKSLCDSKNDIFMATPGCSHSKGAAQTRAQKGGRDPFKEEKSGI